MKDMKFFVVWGMHRSGTSLLAAALRIFGAELGNDLLCADQCNPTGYFEDQKLMALNEQMLRRLGMRWNTLSPVMEEQAKLLIDEGFLRAATDFLHVKGKSGCAGMKDPRMTRLAPFWSRVFIEMGIAPFSIVVWRSPISVAQSLRKRALLQKYTDPVLNLTYGCLLWAGYTVSALVNTADWPRVLVDYDSFLKNPVEILHGISRQTGIPLDPNQTDVFCRQFVDKDLNHNDSESHAEKMPESALKIYELLKEYPGPAFPPAEKIANICQLSEERRELYSLLDNANIGLRERERKMASMLEGLNRLESERKSLAKELAFIHSTCKNSGN